MATVSAFQRPRLLDLYCCAGGAAMGYHRAGFDVYGVDINPQPRYPFAFHQGDALEVLAALTAGKSVIFTRPDGSTEALILEDFAAIHASPPCQRYTRAASLPTNPIEHPDLLAPTRDALDALDLPYIIENVPESPMQNYVTLCGSEFGLVAADRDGVMVQLRRHRQFESNIWLWGAGGCNHDPDMVTASIFGWGGGMHHDRRDDPERAKGYIPHDKVAAALLGIDWMKKREMSESIPPAYTEFIGRQLMVEL